MKIVFSRFTRAYAEEYYYVLINQKKFLRRPAKTISRATRAYAFYCAFSFICFIVSIWLGINSFNYLPLIFITGLTFGLIIFVSLKLVKAVRELGDGDAKKCHLDLSAKGIAYTLPAGDILLPWENVLKITITEHSVIFLPDTLEILPICVPAEAKDKIKTQLKKLKKSPLLS